MAYWDREVSIGTLVGETLTDVQGMAKGSDTVTLTTASGRVLRMYHEQDCCESVELADVTGDPADLLGVPLLKAEEVSNENDGDRPGDYAESWTWTFYTFATVKGYVTLRWLGESNGYYSESVQLVQDSPAPEARDAGEEATHG